MDTSALLMNSCAPDQWSHRSSDSEFYSMSSPETISPASSMDLSFSSWCRTPSSVKAACPVDFVGDDVLSSSSACRGVKVGRTRSKNPSKQRQLASEKEKLRMRDLTKALHHLRTYLPPSVAPAGQTLTKIETLRLTIHYISHLMEQLGLSEETLSQGKNNSCSVQENSLENSLEVYQRYCQNDSTLGYLDQGQGWHPCTEHYEGTLSVKQPTQNIQLDYSLFSTSLKPPAQDVLLDSSTESPQPAVSTEPSQVYRKSIYSQAVAADFWI